MLSSPDCESDDLRIAQLWCESKGEGWTVTGQLGQGATASVFEVRSIVGQRALKIYSAEFSSGRAGAIEEGRVASQLSLTGHSCASLVHVYEGGRLEERLYVLMSRAPGRELGRRLGDVPRLAIRRIVAQVAAAAIFLRDRNLCHRDIKAANIFISEDFSQATLLDVSVIRNVYDPIGAGTDHDGQLPMVATARYSPPEYLFRLLEPGPDLWHALTVYQLGALLHDMIMKRSLFEAEHLACAENRYRFAWIVATAIPQVQSADVDQDLVFLANRALDKDWRRRSSVRLEDFLEDATVQREHALQLIGLGTDGAGRQAVEEVAARLRHVVEVAKALEETVRAWLGERGVRATHEMDSGGSDTSKSLVFRWEAPGTGEGPGAAELRVRLEHFHRVGGGAFRVSMSLSTLVCGAEKAASMELPELQDESGVESVLMSQVAAAVETLAVEITKPTLGRSEA